MHVARGAVHVLPHRAHPSSLFTAAAAGCGLQTPLTELRRLFGTRCRGWEGWGVGLQTGPAEERRQRRPGLMNVAGSKVAPEGWMEAPESSKRETMLRK